MKSAARLMLSSTMAIQPLSVLALVMLEYLGRRKTSCLEAKFTHYRKMIWSICSTTGNPDFKIDAEIS